MFNRFFVSRRRITDIVPYGYNFGNTNFSVVITAAATVVGGIASMFMIFATKHDLEIMEKNISAKFDTKFGAADKRMDILDNKIDKLEISLRTEMKNNTELILQRVENMILRSKQS